jgi:hypothetical protein
MKAYKVAYKYTMIGEVCIEAASLEEAMKIVGDMPHALFGTLSSRYSSFEVNEDFSRELNKDV